MENLYFYDTDIGRIGIAEENDQITRLFIASKEEDKYDCEINETDMIKKCYQELLEYLGGRRKTFDLPLNPRGTEFQKRVWDSLLNIPYGETRSYKDIAESAGSPKGYRAVGMANNKNPIMIIIPCHRVIGANGKMVGYGFGIDVKKKLLDLESN